MKYNIKRIILGSALVLGLAATTLAPTSSSAIDVFSGSCGSGSGTTGNSANRGNGANTNNNGGNGTANSSTGSSSTICGANSSDSAPDIVKNVINTMLYILGIIAVIMIVIGGIRYTTSNGDSSQTKAAKDTILYAVVGLIVAIMAFAIVNFVVQSFK